MAYKVFISSVQREFAKERRAIAAAIRKDRVLKLFFEPFLSRRQLRATVRRRRFIWTRCAGATSISASSETRMAMQIRGDALKSNPGLVSLETIQKWDGKAPQTLVVGDGVKPLLNVK